MNRCIDLPLLSIARDGYLDATYDPKHLEKCTRQALGSGYFDGLLLVDKSGSSWIVAKVRGVGSRSDRLWGRIGFRLVQVELDLRDSERFDLRSLKTRVEQAIDRSPAQWEGALHGVSSIKEDVARAGNMETLIRLFVGQS